MRTVRTVAGVRAAVSEWRARSARPGHDDLVGLVPTMGALHDGHLALIAKARKDCGLVVVSLFVNPAQFERPDDLATYPRDEARDRDLAASAGADLLFAPAAGEVYPPGFDTTVSVGGVTELLEGDRAGRGPDHFRGVATVVTKLFNMVGPDTAYFGEKDAQQAVVIRKLVRDLDLPVKVETVPTVRDPDGLALSSRNVQLDPAERERAVALSRALAAGRSAVAAGDRDGGAVTGAARAELVAAGVQPEYVELRSAADLSPASRVNGSTLLLVAARVGRVRLIDNTLLGDQESEGSGQEAS